VGDFDLRNPIYFLVLGTGALLMGIMASRTFGRIHGGMTPGNSDAADMR
jgi:hypothetical protein